MRVLEKREASVEGLLQQYRQEGELKVVEANSEISRLRRQVEAELKALNETTRNEIRQRDGHMQQLDTVARSSILQIKALEERSASLEVELKASVERRLGIMSEGIARYEQASLDRFIAHERLLEKEVTERVKADVEVRRELEDTLQAVKSAAKADANDREQGYREMKRQIADLSKVCGVCVCVCVWCVRPNLCVRMTECARVCMRDAKTKFNCMSVRACVWVSRRVSPKIFPRNQIMCI